MKLFHISHTDLDGYGCHLLTKEFFKDGFFLNANYGLEVRLSCERVIDEIKKLSQDEEILFIISDVNLTQNESKELNKNVNALIEQGYKIKLQLLDHHATGQKSADEYDWYFLDTSRCATKIVYDYLCKEFNAFQEEQDAWVEPLVNCINAIDIWLEHETNNFEFGKVLLSMISKVREINNVLFANDNRDFRIYLLKEASKYIGKENDNISLDNDVHALKKAYLNLDGKDDTIDNLSAKYLVKSLEKIKEELSITYKGHKGLLTYCLGSISIPANAFLKANSDYDFFIDVNKKGSTSLRADGKVDVSLIAEKMAKGGGHVNAAGCKIDDFKESINFQDVRAFMQQKLDSIN